ncbi:RNA 2',3'-cyclic phosphodiesterase [Acidimangrovimonas sediminis]|uniref:RNA 2',3'-cyclic phosphodiesterase n=1 Tax=Acidimangrovimonas sediminis TaxID=2056283 RepID=UPI000C7F9C2D|nr:RNA 2',3'-cyclic phosphodiesterase [Acidimangrovimonas sediminis]
MPRRRHHGGGTAGAGRRVFVALDPPEDIREALDRLALMLPLPRRVARENLHLTLAFLGPQPDPALEELDRELQDLHAPPFEIALQGLGLFGGTRPRAAWAGVVPCPALDTLQAQVAAAARRAGTMPEARRFVPHVTLGRFPPRAVLAPGLEQALVTLGDFRAGPWPVGDLTLFESLLHPEGARYTPLARYPLHA